MTEVLLPEVIFSDCGQYWKSHQRRLNSSLFLFQYLWRLSASFRHGVKRRREHLACQSVTVDKCWSIAHIYGLNLKLKVGAQQFHYLKSWFYRNNNMAGVPFFDKEDRWAPIWTVLGGGERACTVASRYDTTWMSTVEIQFLVPKESFDISGVIIIMWRLHEDCWPLLAMAHVLARELAEVDLHALKAMAQ